MMNFNRILALMLLTALVLPILAVNPAGGAADASGSMSDWSAVQPFRTLAQATSSTAGWSVVGTPGSQPGRNDILNPVINGLPTGSEIHDMASANDGNTVAAIVTVNGKAFDPSAASTPLSILYSTNTMGMSWSTDAYNNLVHTLGWQSGRQVFNIAIAPDDPKYYAVTSGQGNPLATPYGPRMIWITTNGGQSWVLAYDGTGLTGADETIRALDISIDYGGKRDIGFVTTSSTGGRWVVGTSTDLTVWNDQTISPSVALPAGLLTFGTVDPMTNVDFYAIKFSPTYNGDLSVALVFATDAANATLNGGGTYYNVATRDLNQNYTTGWAFNNSINVRNSALTSDSPHIFNLNNVVLQLPSDFSGQSSSLRRAYISLDAMNGPVGGVVGTKLTQDGIYRIDDDTTFVLMETTFTTTKSIYSIAYFGTYTSGKLLVGERLGFPCTATVATWFTDAPTSSSNPTWFPALKPATGAANQGACSIGSQSGIGGAIVAWNADGSLGLCTTGSNAEVAGSAWYSPLLGTPVPNDESAFSVSRNNAETWDQLGLIDTTIDWLNDVAPSYDGTTIYLASANRTDGGGCGEFDSVWRSTTNGGVAAPLQPVSPIGSYWERVYCRPTAGNCTIAQSDLPILRVVNSALDMANGEIVGCAAEGAFANADNTGGIMAWSPDFGEYWATIVLRDPVQDFTFSSSTQMFVLSPDGKVQNLPYTGTSWSTTLPSYSTGLQGAHTIVASANNVLVGANASTNAAGYAASVSQDSGVTWTVVQQKLPTNGNVHVAFDLNSSGGSFIFAAADNGPLLNAGSPHVAGSLPGAVYRNTFPTPTAWVNIMSRSAGARGPSWWPSTTAGDPPHSVGQFGVVSDNPGAALFSAHDKISLKSAPGPTSPPVASAVCYTGSATNAMPQPGIDWQCFNAYSDAGVGSAAADTVRFTLEPSSLKRGGQALYAIDDEAFGQYLGTATGYSPNASPPVRGCLWSYAVPRTPSAPTLTPCATVNTSLGTVKFCTTPGSISGLKNIPPENMQCASGGYIFFYGMFSFNITNLAPGATATVTVTTPIAIPMGARVFKCQHGSLTDFSDHSTQLDPNTFVLTLTDGGPGDADGTVNGTIVDPSGPAFMDTRPPQSSSAQVPTSQNTVPPTATTASQSNSGASATSTDNVTNKGTANGSPIIILFVVLLILAVAGGVTYMATRKR
jgi:hypothetical protein